MTATRPALGPLSALGLSRFGYGLFVPAMAEQLHWSLTDAGGLNLLAGVSPAAALPLLAHHPLLVTASALLFGATFMMIPAAVTAYVSAKTSTDTTGTLGRLTVLFAAGQTLGPWLCGLLADRTTPGAALAWTAVLCAAAAAFATAPVSRPRSAPRRPPGRRWQP